MGTDETKDAIDEVELAGINSNTSAKKLTVFSMKTSSFSNRLGCHLHSPRRGSVDWNGYAA